MKVGGVCSWLTCLGLLIGLTGTAATGSQMPSQIVELEIDQDVHLNGRAGDVAHFSFTTSEPWIDLEVEGHDGDVSVRLLDADGTVLHWPHGPGSRRDVEYLVWHAAPDNVSYASRALDSATPRTPLRFLVDVPFHATTTATLRLRTLTHPTPRERRQLAARRLASLAAEAYRQSAREDRERSLALYRKALDAWQDLGNDFQAARLHYAIAVQERRQGEPGASRSADQALQRYRAAADLHGEAAVLNFVGIMARQAGDPVAAEASYRLALDRFSDAASPCGEAHALLNLGLLQQHLGAASAAIDLFESAVERCPVEDDPQFGADLLVSMAGAYDAQGELRLSIDTLKRALPLLEGQARTSHLEVAWGNLGSAYRKIGDYQGAFDAYHQGLTLARQTGDLRRQATLLNSLGFAYLRLGEPQRGLVFLQQSLPLRRQTGQRRGEAVTLANLGMAYKDLSKFALARDHLTRSLTLRRELGDRRGESTTLLRLGLLEQQAGDLTASAEWIEGAHVLSLETENHRLAAQAMVYLAEIAGQRPDATADLDAALWIERLVAAQQTLAAVGDRELETQAWVVLAQMQQRLQRWDAAQASLAQAIERVESVRSRIGDPTLRSTFLAQQNKAYRQAIDLAVRRHRLEPDAGWHRRALELDERSKARGLLDLVNSAEQELAEQRDPELAAQRQHWIETLRGVQSRLDRARGDVRSELQHRYQHALSSLEHVEAQLRREHEDLAALLDPQILDVDAMQGMLDESTLVLSFALGDERSYLWALDHTRLDLHHLPPRQTLEQQSRRLHDLWSELEVRADGEQEQLAADLSQQLLGPVAEVLARYRRLVFVLDGTLHLVPMAAIPIPGEGNVAEPLIARFEVVHLPSMSVLAGLRRRSAADSESPHPSTGPSRLAGGGVVLIADPVFELDDWQERYVDLKRASTAVGGRAEDSDTGRDGGASSNRQPARVSDRTALVRGESSMPRLPASGDEARAIAALVPQRSRMLLGRDASRSAVLAGQLGGASIIHFATHGQIDPVNPRLSGLSLSRWGAAGQSVEGHLSLHDIYQLRLPKAELVVLNGCRTAMGKSIRGEGLLGLTRGFMQAGAPRVVATLWTVQDRASQDLMQGFYRSLLLEGESVSAALRQAQNAMRRQPEWSDPYFWAAYVHQGEWQ